MPIIKQHRIYRRYLQNNPDVLFVFGDNMLRKGMGGQAAQMRGEPNAVGVATKYLPNMSEEAFYNDRDFERIKANFMCDILPIELALERGKIVIWPSDGIGTGFSEVSTRAPKVWDLMESVRRRLERITR